MRVLGAPSSPFPGTASAMPTPHETKPSTTILRQTRNRTHHAASGHSLQYAESKQHVVKWWTYSHACRVLLLGTGDAGAKLQVCACPALLVFCLWPSKQSLQAGGSRLAPL